MAESTTDFYLPPFLPYPITIVSIDAPEGTEVTRGARLLSYTYKYQPLVKDAEPEKRISSWDAPFEGTVVTWNLKAKTVISSHLEAEKTPAVTIEEPCKHAVQFGGMCAVCGKNLDIADYTGFSETSRASIQMTHTAFGPTVSLEEAQRIERETAEHLLNSRKLSLIVDLDQTIVHATVDTTVGIWFQEGEAWEERQAQRQARRDARAAKVKSTTPTDSDDSDSDISSDEDEDEDDANDPVPPDWYAIKDVKQFRLGPDGFVPSGRDRTRGKMQQSDGCIYYIKPRPGWKEFLEEASTKYEMHVYTMGTRAYAEQVCGIIDPERKFFGDRILSRDESGSLTQKNLQRLFPCDTSMVVIIDDRADVWEWSPNLVKVIPYEFYVGIGDINSTFLPKIKPLTPAPTTTPGDADQSPDVPDAVDSEASSAEAVAETEALVQQHNAALIAQQEERPLAKREKELQEQEDAKEDECSAEQTPTTAAEASASSTTPDKHHHHHHHRAPVLKNDDVELIRVGKILDEVHRRYFDAHSSKGVDDILTDNSRKKGASTHREADVTRIIPHMREEVLGGCHILFSGLIPLDKRPETAEIWRMATMFGAKCYTELTKAITHVVAGKAGTVKVEQARKRGSISIVSQAWLTDSIAYWRRMEEKPYLLEDVASVPVIASASATSSPADDWEEEDATMNKPGGLSLAEVDWLAANDEVDAAMMESDDEDEDGIGAEDEHGDGTKSEQDWSDNDSVKSLGADGAPQANPRKRLRSLTPSESGLERDADALRSPLSKRKKVAAERSGMSKLKEGISASDVGSENGSPVGSPRMEEDYEGDYMQADEEDEEGDGDDSEWGDDLENCLAEELEGAEDWG